MKNRRKTGIAIAKFFALHANVKKTKSTSNAYLKLARYLPINILEE